MADGIADSCAQFFGAIDPSWGYSIGNVINLEPTCCYHVTATFTAVVSVTDGTKVSNIDINFSADPGAQIYPGAAGGCTGPTDNTAASAADSITGSGTVSVSVDYFICNTTTLSISSFFNTVWVLGVADTWALGMTGSVAISGVQCSCVIAPTTTTTTTTTPPPPAICSDCPQSPPGAQPPAAVSGIPGIICAALNSTNYLYGGGFIGGDCTWAWQLDVQPLRTIILTFDHTNVGSEWHVKLNSSGGFNTTYEGFFPAADITCIAGVITGTVVLSFIGGGGSCPDAIGSTCFVTFG